MLFGIFGCFRYCSVAALCYSYGSLAAVPFVRCILGLFGEKRCSCSGLTRHGPAQRLGSRRKLGLRRGAANRFRLTQGALQPRPSLQVLATAERLAQWRGNLAPRRQTWVTSAAVDSVTARRRKSLNQRRDPEARPSWLPRRLGSRVDSPRHHFDPAAAAGAHAELLPAHCSTCPRRVCPHETCGKRAATSPVEDVWRSLTSPSRKPFLQLPKKLRDRLAASGRCIS